jgi:hypothetical protein
MPAVLPRDVLARGQGAVVGPVVLRPSPRIQLHLASHPALTVGVPPRRDDYGSARTAVADGLGARRDRRRDERASAARPTWRISSSYAAISENDGQAAITRPVIVGSATATFAARLAALPATSSAHGRKPPRLPARKSASSVVDAATIIPSTDIRRQGATHPRLLIQLDQQVDVQVQHRRGDQCQDPHAPDSCPPDPPIRPANRD